MFGVVDFTRDIKVQINQPIGVEQKFIRYMIVCAAVSINATPIDCPYMSVNDDAGFVKDTAYSSSIGYRGRIIIYPSQVSYANKLYSPLENRLEWAKEIVEVYEEECIKKGLGAINYKGQIIAYAVYASAKELLGNNNA